MVPCPWTDLAQIRNFPVLGKDNILKLRRNILKSPDTSPLKNWAENLNCKWPSKQCSDLQAFVIYNAHLFAHILVNLF